MKLHADVHARFTAAGAEPFTVDASIDVEPGETLVVLGPSGSGKTLLLESLAGFHDHDGTVSLNGTVLTDTPPERRDFGFVFQDYALFPHRTVRENVAFGTRYHDDVRDPDEVLASLGVAGLAARYPGTLSGGEKQRVALARSLVIRPRVLLLDEPLSALDVPTQQRLRTDLADAIADVTSVYVTHDRTTARALADRVAVMHEGSIVQTGPPDEVFEHPASSFVARFVGANVLPAGVDGDAPVAIRPEHVRVDAGGHRGTVHRVVREETTHRVTVEFDWGTVDAFASNPPTSDEVAVSFPAEHATVLAE